MVEFRNRLSSKRSGAVIDPVKLYDTLDRAHDKGPLRPAQIAVLEEWFSSRHDERDVIVKLHTGQGVFPGRAAQPLVTASCPGVTQSFMAVSPTFSILSDWVNTQWQNGGETHYTHEKILQPHGEFKTSYAAFSHFISSCRGGTTRDCRVLSSVPYGCFSYSPQPP